MNIKNVLLLICEDLLYDLVPGNSKKYEASRLYHRERGERYQEIDLSL